jgi:3-oxoacyl-[acyl-carrier protein] reductase
MTSTRASRGLGRGIATAFAEAGAPVVAVSRTAAAFPEPRGPGHHLHPGAARITPLGDVGRPAVQVSRPVESWVLVG